MPNQLPNEEEYISGIEIIYSNSFILPTWKLRSQTKAKKEIFKIT